MKARAKSLALKGAIGLTVLGGVAWGIKKATEKAIDGAGDAAAAVVGGGVDIVDAALGNLVNSPEQVEKLIVAQRRTENKVAYGEQLRQSHIARIEAAVISKKHPETGEDLSEEQLRSARKTLALLHRHKFTA